MRSVGFTSVSRRSSRSHTILTLSLTQNTTLESDTSSLTSKRAEMVKKSKICLVDLAGSERVDHSGADGLRLREAGNINRSLATLAEVVIALSRRKRSKPTGSSLQQPPQQKNFVPYRSSVLTRLLKESLGGNAKTIMLGVVSPCCAHYEESLSTLKYIERTKSVVNNVRANVETNRDLVQELQDEVSDLKAKLQAVTVGVCPIVASGVNEADCELLSVGAADGSPSASDPDRSGAVSDHLPMEQGSGSLSGTLDDSTESSMVSSSTSVGHYRRENEKLECEVAALKDKLINQERDFQMEVKITRKLHERVSAQVLQQNMYLMKLMAIRRRWQSLCLYRALERWKTIAKVHIRTQSSVRSGNAMEQNGCARTEDTGDDGGTAADLRLSGGDDTMKAHNHLKVYPSWQIRQCPATAEIRLDQPEKRCLEDRIALAKADELCCSVVEAFMLHGVVDSGPIPRKPIELETTSVSPLELLASNSEFDRPEQVGDSSGYWGEVSHELFELASSRHWEFDSKEGAGSERLDQSLGQQVRDVDHAIQPSKRRSDGSLVSPGLIQPLVTPSDREAIRSTLSLCIGSIDMARRSMGPCLRKLRLQVGNDAMAPINTGVERGLLSCLDKRFATMSNLLEETVAAIEMAPMWEQVASPSKGFCETLEAILGEFCLQIVARVCDQLPNSSSGCSAGRRQLEKQLESFQDRLKQQLLPAISRDASLLREQSATMVAVLVATELFGMSERVEVVLRAVEQKKRQRLAQAHMIEAHAFNLQTLAEGIKTLEVRNEEVLSECDALKKEVIRLREAADEVKTKASQQEYDHASCNDQIEEATDMAQGYAMELDWYNHEQAVRIGHLEEQLHSRLIPQTKWKDGGLTSSFTVSRVEKTQPLNAPTDDKKSDFQPDVAMAGECPDTAADEKEAVAKLESMSAQTLKARVQNAELNDQIAAVNRQLTVALARVCVLEDENQRLTESQARESDLGVSAATNESNEEERSDLRVPDLVDGLRLHVQRLQAALAQEQTRASELVSRVNAQDSMHLQQSAKLQELETLLADANNAHSRMEASFVALQCQLDAMVHELKLQVVACQELAAQTQEQGATRAMENEELRQEASERLGNLQEEKEKLVCSLKTAESELSGVAKKEAELQRICAQQEDEITTLQSRLNEARTELEAAVASACTLDSKCVALEIRLAAQLADATSSENLMNAESQRLVELQLKQEALEETHSRQTLTLSRTEKELTFIRERKELLESQLEEISARKQEDVERLECELNSSIAQAGAVRAELGAMSDRCLAQSALIKKLQTDMLDASENVKNLERELQKLVSQCQDLVDQRDKKGEEVQKCTLQVQQWKDKAVQMEFCQEIERQAHMAMHEVVQRRESELQLLQAQTTALEKESCSRLRLLETQINDSTMAARVLETRLKTAETEFEARTKAAEERASALTTEVNEWQARFQGEQSAGQAIRIQLKTCQENISRNTQQLAKTETRCTALQFLVEDLTSRLAESNEICLMQLADVESSRWNNARRRVNQQTTNEAELMVQRHLSSLHTWFDTMIASTRVSAPMATTHLKVEQSLPESLLASGNSRRIMRGGRFPRSLALKSLPAISDESVEVGISNFKTANHPKETVSSVKGDKSNHGDPCRTFLDQILAVTGTTRFHDQLQVAVDADTKGLEIFSDVSSPKMSGGLPQRCAGKCVLAPDAAGSQEQDGSSEILQLRATVVKLKEMLDAKDDLLMFLDDKMTRIESLQSAQDYRVQYWHTH